MRRIRPLLCLLSTLTLTDCVSAHTRHLNVVRDRADKLKPLASWAPTRCRVEAQLTEPAAARYRNLFPTDHADPAVLAYTWAATERSCAVATDETSAVAENFRAVLDVALCRLVQTHFVNSPFDELEFDPRLVDARDGRVVVRTGDVADVGLYLDTKTVSIETRTKSGGTLDADYAVDGSIWLPRRMAQRTGSTVIQVYDTAYDAGSAAAQRALREFTVGVGETDPLPMARVRISDCRPND